MSAYITLSDVRAENISADPFTNEWVTDRINKACTLVDMLIGSFFEAREGHVITLNGRGHPLLWLPVPPVTETAITSVTVNGEAIESTSYEVVMDESSSLRTTQLFRTLGNHWPKGIRNIVVAGTFGIVDVVPGDPVTFATPILIKELVARICIWGLPKIGDSDGLKDSRIVEEKLKDYSYKLQAVGNSGYFKDPKIDNLIALYQLPAMGVA